MAYIRRLLQKQFTGLQGTITTGSKALTSVYS